MPTTFMITLMVCLGLLHHPVAIAAPRPDKLQIEGWLKRDFEDVGYLDSMLVSLEFSRRNLIRVKAVRSDGRALERLYDLDGTPIEERYGEIIRVEGVFRHQMMGALSDRLWNVALAQDDVTPIPVGIWLRTYEPLPDKAAALDDPILMQYFESIAQESRASAADMLRADWTEISDSPLFIEPDMPAATAELTREELFTLADHPAVTRLSFLNELAPGTSNYVNAVRSNVYAYDGVGQSVCVIELLPTQTPNTLTIQDSRCQTATTSSHARWVMGIIRSATAPFGTATLSTDFANSRSCTGMPTIGADGPASKWCKDKLARVWNISFYGLSGADDYFGNLYDYRAIRAPFPMINVISGNVNVLPGPACASTCSTNQEVEYFNNGLTVGGSDDCGTDSRSDDVLLCISAGLNRTNPGSPSDQIERPNLVAPGRDITSEGLTQTGTSAAAPQVSGAAAQLLQHDSALVGWPEATRAILMASALEDVHGVILNLGDSTDDRDGAGELDIGRAHEIAGNHRNGGDAPAPNGYDFGTIDQTVTPAGSFWPEVYAARLQTGYPSRLRAVVAWNHDPTCTNVDLYTWGCNLGDTLSADVDMYVYRRSTGAIVAISTTFYNNYEFIDIPVVPGETYDIKFRVWSWQSSASFFGIAWKVY